MPDTDPPETVSSRFWFRPIAVASGLVIVTVVVLVITKLVASGKVEAVEDAWARSLGTMDDLIDRFPSRDVNQAALDIEKLSAARSCPRASGRPRAGPSRTPTGPPERAETTRPGPESA